MGENPGFHQGFHGHLTSLAGGMKDVSQPVSSHELHVLQVLLGE